MFKLSYLLKCQYYIGPAIAETITWDWACNFLIVILNLLWSEFVESMSDVTICFYRCWSCKVSLKLLSFWFLEPWTIYSISFPALPSRPLLMEKPDIVVGTPSRVLGHLVARNLTLRDSLEMVVIDEADLVFSFGYETDVKALLTYVACVEPKLRQCPAIHK